jgi:hypothetical protein
VSGRRRACRKRTFSRQSGCVSGRTAWPQSDLRITRTLLYRIYVSRACIEPVTKQQSRDTKAREDTGNQSFPSCIYIHAPLPLCFLLSRRVLAIKGSLLSSICFKIVQINMSVQSAESSLIAKEGIRRLRFPKFYRSLQLSSHVCPPQYLWQLYYS